MPKKTVFLTTLLASLLTVGVAPARADHPDRSRPHTRIEVSRLEVLSHRLERSVRHLQREVRRCTDDRRQREHKALPALHRLEKRGSLASEWKRTERGRRARYYHLTDQGAEELDALRARWKGSAWAVQQVLEAKG